MTNTLVPTDEVPRIDVPFLAHEAEKAHEVKEHLPVTVVYGNPPYAGHSANASKNADGTLNFIGRLLRDYFQVDGKPLNERQPKWLQDDYVKFMRYGQWRIQQTGAGILAMITNHGYLDNPTFRGMRQQLMQTFDEIYVLDLHGNSKKKEVAPDGSPDENVFDIMQGVAICLMVKHRDSKGKLKVHHAHLYGSRDAKYAFLGNNDMQQIEWQSVKPQSPFYLFIHQNTDVRTEYERGWKITEVFPQNNVGFVTARDSFVIDFDETELRSRIEAFRSTERHTSTEQLESLYGLKNTSSWRIKSARESVRNNAKWKQDFVQGLYRPFDARHIYYSLDILERPVYQIQRHMLSDWNLGLVVPRRVEVLGPWQHAFVSGTIIDHVALSAKTIDSLLPLYLYPTEENPRQHSFALDEPGTGLGGRKPNLAPNFIKYVKDKLHVQFVEDGTGDLKKTVGPEDIFHYIYAVLHSPTYRERYVEFLKGDFPRVPITSDLDLFRTLAKLGKELVPLHLMESPKLNRAITRYVGRGDDGVAAGYPTFEDETVWINDTQGFKGVPEDVWGFHVGGYQVCHKWLKDRRGRELSEEDKARYAKIVVALQETMRLMEEIDAAILGWPIQ